MENNPLQKKRWNKDVIVVFFFSLLSIPLWFIGILFSYSRIDLEHYTFYTYLAYPAIGLLLVTFLVISVRVWRRHDSTKQKGNKLLIFAMALLVLVTFAFGINLLNNLKCNVRGNHYPCQPHFSELKETNSSFT